MRWKTLPPSQLNELVKNGDSIYVINSSAMESGDKGTIVINFINGNRKDFFKMPPTFIPMAISDSIPHDQLMNSRDFKESLVKGMLTLVDPKQAEEYLSTEEAAEEYEALVLSEHSARARGGIETSLGARTKVSHNSTEANGPMQEVSAVDTVSNKVRGIVESTISGEYTAKDALTLLRRHQTALSSADLSYVIGHIDNQEVIDWASKAISESRPIVSNKQNVGGSSAAQKTFTAPTPATAKKDVAFDLDDRGIEMSPEEQAEDARLRAEAMANQAVNGQSQAQNEIDKILKGQI